MNKIIFFFSFVFFVVLSYIVLQYESNDKIDKHLEETTTRYSQNYNLIYNDYKILSSVIFDTKINTKEVIDTFKEASDAPKEKQAILREQLFLKLKDTYKLLQNHNLKQLHFHLPNNDSFLRFHRPEKFGDNLSNVRATIKYVNESKKPIDGFEEGRIYNGYRFVYPLFDGERHIGSVEVSFSTLAMNTEMMKNFDVLGKFLISKKVVGEKVFKDEKSNYVESKFEDFYYEAKVDDQIQVYNKHNVKLLVSQNTKDILKKRAFDTESFSLYDTASNSIMTFLKIQNPISNEVVGIFLIRSDGSYVIAKKTNTRFIFGILIVFLVLLHIFIYRILYQKQLLNRLVEEKTEQLTRTNRELEESQYEIELINQNLEKRIKDEISISRSKDKIISEQSKMVAMGEMIGNIAHHWRQPLSAITTSITGMLVQKEFGLLDDNTFKESCERINDNAQYLSKTIDDFRNMLRGDSIKERFNVAQVIHMFIGVNTKLINEEKITIQLNLNEEIMAKGIRNELGQCLVNLLNNAKDAMVNKPDKFIFIDLFKDKDYAVITFKDSGGGIEENILDKVFEPYFTTKHQSRGTGLGLHGVYKMIVDGMEGSVSVENDVYNYNEKKLKGAKIIISLVLEND
jgi:signal transduction histidine kinase